VEAVGAAAASRTRVPQLNEFDAAEQSYAEGGALAAAIGTRIRSC